MREKIDKVIKKINILNADEKLDEHINKHGKMVDTIVYVIIGIIIILFVSTAIKSCTTITITPDQKEINETCAMHGMKPNGYNTNTNEGYTEITCKTTYYNQTQNKNFYRTMETKWGIIGNHNCIDVCKTKSTEYGIQTKFCPTICVN